MYYINELGHFCEDTYDMNKQPLSSTLFTTGNGYMGVRGSFEEFGELKIQGAFVRGFIDEIIEVCEPFANNEYMKKYYLDEEKLKSFERQDSCVNMHDFLFVRIKIGESIFYPWDGKLIELSKELDTDKGIYIRHVIWEDEDNNQTEITFTRFASFYNQHLYVQRINVKPLNHHLKISFISGVDTYRKTGGQIITKTDELKIDGSNIEHAFHALNKYHFTSKYHIINKFPKGKLCNYEENGVYGINCSCDSLDEYTLDKFTFIETSRDVDLPLNIRIDELDYNYQYDMHVKAYEKYFEVMDVKIEGDKDADGYLRYASYQTAISASLHDSVHGISAKSLSGERYNQFVWWDQEMHQLPFFFATAPNTAKNALMYRYRLLDQAKENAKKEGFDGAKYAFCSSVYGDELVWKYARHPFMQIHINSDVPMGIINYFDWTKDIDYLNDYGFIVIYECLKYWLSRLKKTERGYELLEVTGTDEHHPYVNNDAYTNYCVKYVFNRFVELYNKYSNHKLVVDNLNEIKEVGNKIYLPLLDNGMIPQFDGYFDLSKTLISEGSLALKQFQMKKSGLYQYSQIIKQPDVALLYTFTNIDMDPKNYAMNWNYYEKMCETSSSLTFPVHAVASIDNNQILSFYNYFMDTLKIDIDDIHEVGYQGLHAGCLAGGYYAILRGVFGVKAKEDYLEINPKLMPLFKKITIKCIYQGSYIRLVMDNNIVKVTLLNNKPCNIKNNDNISLLESEKEIII